MSEAEKTVELESEEEKMIYFECTADNSAGKAVFKIIANGNNISVEKEIELPVRPTVPHVNEIISGGLDSGEDKEIIFESKWMPGTEEYQLKLSPYPTVKFAESLSYLLRYPYGCLEQTTSRVFPLLYFDDLARMAEPDMFLEGSADYYIQEGILKIQTMQMNGGAFSYWPGGTYSNTWATIYSSHFLVEARKAGYNVANFVFDRMVNNLRSFVKGEADSPYELQKKVYALYVLALANEYDLSSMNYIKNHRLEELYDDSRTMLAAAYYYIGKKDISNQLIRYEYSGFDIDRETGGNFNSNTRSEAIVLSVLADIDPEHRSIPGLVERLADKAEIRRWGTTQDNAFAFMALGKAFSRHEDQTYSGTIFLNAEEIQSFDEQDNIVLDSLESGDRLKIETSGNGTVYYNIKSSGVPLDNTVTLKDQGIEIYREYLDKEGNHVELNQIEQGDMIIAKITVDSYSGHLENVVIVDMLPAGLEIENPRLGNRPGLDWINNSSLSPNYMDIRDDRLLLFTDVQRYDEQYFYYALRAVTAGDFTLPPIKAECMYEPEIYSINGIGKIRVVK
ncbi:MAG: alpha-2-macroglobulin family protein, partial [Halanaerobiales bacterium]